jgi:DNA helicase IV
MPSSSPDDHIPTNTPAHTATPTATNTAANTDEPGTTTGTLEAEQHHLDTARQALRSMRERVESLEAEGGNPVSTEYLKATLYHRAKSLVDDPSTPLFFGRIDIGGGIGVAGETFHVGRRHVQDDSGDPLVVDWRADVSKAFYRATRKAPMGVVLRRRFGFFHGALTAYEDEHLADATEEAHRSRILEAEIERPREGPMRDIVATIQPEQDALVRADVEETLCVQGAPGTGKTAVGLHRAAYLLYAHRDRLRRTGVLVVGPNASFLRYIRDVLPALGEIDAKETTVEALVSERASTGTDPAARAMLKGDVRMAKVLRRAVWASLTEPTEPLVLPRGSVRFRVPAYELAEIVEELRTRGVRYAAGRAMLAQRIAHAVLVRMEAAGESPDDRTQDAVARSRPIRALVDILWPQLDPPKLLFALFTDPGRLARAADGLLDADEQALLRWHPAPRTVGRARWSAADLVLLDEIGDLLHRTPSVGHVVLDEAQDLSAMQLRAVGRRCTTGSATVLGDLAQGTTPWSAESWNATLEHLGKPGARLDELTEGFRVPADVINFAARLLPTIAPGLRPPTSVRQSRGDLVITSSPDPVAAAPDAVRGALARPGSVGVIVADADVDAAGRTLAAAGIAYTVLGAEDDVDARLDLVPASLAKGLEFDHVVLLEPAAIVAGEPDERTGLRRLYVCLTRAVTSLAVVHAAPLPAALG